MICAQTRAESRARPSQSPNYCRAAASCTSTLALGPAAPPWCARLQLVLASAALEHLADAARRRAHAVHEGLVIVALAALGPSPARLIVVHAHRRAESARVGALLHHCERVGEAFSGLGPDFALRRVVVRTADAVAHAAGVRALFVHEPRVLVALAIRRPARAVALDILARRLARLARDGAVADHELRVLIALTSSTPAWALLFQVLALGRAQTARGRAQTEHCIGLRTRPSHRLR